MEIHLSNLAFSYPHSAPILRGISLEIRGGARVALLGQNGAGKTTLVKHLNGLLKPTRGDVQIGDWNTRTHSLAQLARRVGFVFQNPDDQLFKTRVADEIAVGPMNLKWNTAEISKRVAWAIELCGLAEMRDAHPYDLALWQRRWVAIASVLAMQTPIVVLDEPTTGQDALGLARLVSVLEELQRAGVTVIAVTHDIDFATEQFQDLIVLAQGQVVARGDAKIFADEPMLTRAALQAPQLFRLADALGWATQPTGVEEFCAQFEAERVTRNRAAKKHRD